MSNHDSEVTFEIKERVGIISTAPTGWTKEVNIVSWNGGVPKFDIREWDENHVRMSRGLTPQEKEMKRLVNLVEGREKANEAKAKLSPDHEMEILCGSLSGRCNHSSRVHHIFCLCNIAAGSK